MFLKICGLVKHPVKAVTSDLNAGGSVFVAVTCSGHQRESEGRLLEKMLPMNVHNDTNKWMYHISFQLKAEFLQKQ